MDSGAIRAVTILWVILSSVISFMMFAGGSAPGMYLTVFVVITVFQVATILLVEVSESLVNPISGLILAHQPVNGATLVRCKLDASDRGRRLHGGGDQHRAGAPWGPASPH